MSYERYRSRTKLSKTGKVEMLTKYLESYRLLATSDPEQLNLKVSRESFALVLDEVGSLLLQRSKDLASDPGPISDFLLSQAPPGDLAERLPDDFRAFCLLLNAVKQWVAAEQAATDRYLLGGTARQTLRSISNTCTITGEPLAREDIELHHPVRDGRPPVPVSKAAHAKMENQTSHSRFRTKIPSSSNPDIDTDLSPEVSLLALKKGRTWSWVMLRQGCLDLLNQPVVHSTPAVGASSRTFARKAAAATRKNFEWILAYLDERGFA